MESISWEDQQMELSIRGVNFQMSHELREHVNEKFGSLRRLRCRIDSIAVCLGVVRGRLSKECSVILKADVHSVSVREDDPNLYEAVSRAVTKLAHLLRQKRAAHFWAEMNLGCDDRPREIRDTGIYPLIRREGEVPSIGSILDDTDNRELMTRPLPSPPFCLPLGASWKQSN